MWVHLYDAHDPYDPPADLRQRFASARYDGQIAAMDRAVGRLLRDNLSTLVVVTSDHGEALGDHGEQEHGLFVYDAVLHVPLVIRLPDRRGAGTRVDTRVRLADVAPTLIEAAGLKLPAAMQGESLMSLVRPLVRLKPDATTASVPTGNQSAVASGFSQTTIALLPKRNTRAARSAGAR